MFVSWQKAKGQTNKNKNKTKNDLASHLYLPTDLDRSNSVTLLRLVKSGVNPEIKDGVVPADIAELMCKAADVTIEALMILLLPLAKEYAFVPLSNFKVGAVCLGGSGALYFGCNSEFAGIALSTTTPAELSSITNARQHGETKVVTLAITDAPCGRSRQFLNELRIGCALKIILPPPAAASAKQDDIQCFTLGELLPHSFGPNDLGKQYSHGGTLDLRLLDQMDHKLVLDQRADLIGTPVADPVVQGYLQADPVVDAALQGANRSYAPYTKDFSGVALECEDGRVYSGGYEENAAYDPGVSPFQAAFAMLLLGVVPGAFKSGLVKVSRAVLVEPVLEPKKGAKISARPVRLNSRSPRLRPMWSSRSTTLPARHRRWLRSTPEPARSGARTGAHTLGPRPVILHFNTTSDTHTLHTECAPRAFCNHPRFCASVNFKIKRALPFSPGR